MSNISGQIIKTSEGNARLRGYHIQLILLIAKTGFLNVYQLQSLAAALTHNEQTISKVTLNRWCKLDLLRSIKIGGELPGTVYAVAEQSKQICNQFGVTYHDVLEPISYHSQSIASIIYSYFIIHINLINKLTINETLELNDNISDTLSPIDALIIQTSLESYNKFDNVLIPDISFSNSHFYGQHNYSQDELIDMLLTVIEENAYVYTDNTSISKYVKSETSQLDLFESDKQDNAIVQNEASKTELHTSKNLGGTDLDSETKSKDIKNSNASQNEQLISLDSDDDDEDTIVLSSYTNSSRNNPLRQKNHINQSSLNPLSLAEDLEDTDPE